MPIQNQILRLLGFSLLLSLAAQDSWAASGRFESGSLDTEPVFKLNAVRKVQQQPGVVGLDLLIFTQDYPLVQGVFAGSSAERQGVLPGDQIVQINREATLGKSRSQIDAMISDQVGDRVHLLISRNQILKNITLTVLPAQ